MNEKNKIDWIKKLTSRKFWVAITTMVTGYILAFGGSAEAANTVTGCIMSTAAAIAYVIGEGFADGANAGTTDKEDNNDA